MLEGFMSHELLSCCDDNPPTLNSKETDAISVVMPAELFPARPTSCGLPVVNVDVCILGENNQKLPPGGVGEICFRGATVMQE